MPFAATWMDLAIIIRGEVSQIKTNMISLICGIQNVIQMNLFTKKKKNRLRGVEYKLMITKGKEVRDEL